MTVKVGGLEGAFIANPPSRPHCFGADVEERVSDRGELSPDGGEIGNGHKLASQSNRHFLGVEVSAAEYAEICRNLSDFFRLLRTWANKAKQK